MVPRQLPNLIKVKDAEIKLAVIEGNDFISLTDMAKHFGGDRAIVSWIRTKNAIEFLGIWETMNNPDFKPHEFVGFKNAAGSNRFNPSPKQWIETTGAIGLNCRTTDRTGESRKS